mmetsp:Transcript_8021/g.12902  ORF Transcript_8021/g.12902 Transcript_8021/m.12902 type:complete len:316 (+) Transcript_8021:1168-2115(+)
MDREEEEEDGSVCWLSCDLLLLEEEDDCGMAEEEGEGSMWTEVGAGAVVGPPPPSWCWWCTTPTARGECVVVACGVLTMDDGPRWSSSFGSSREQRTRAATSRATARPAWGVPTHIATPRSVRAFSTSPTPTSPRASAFRKASPPQASSEVSSVPSSAVQSASYFSRDQRPFVEVEGGGDGSSSLVVASTLSLPLPLLAVPPPPLGLVSSSSAFHSSPLFSARCSVLLLAHSNDFETSATTSALTSRLDVSLTLIYTFRKSRSANSPSLSDTLLVFSASSASSSSSESFVRSTTSTTFNRCPSVPLRTFPRLFRT